MAQGNAKKIGLDHGDLVGLADDDHTLYASRQDDTDADSAWSTYTPSLTAETTNPTLGTGATQQGRYIQMGKIVIAFIYVQFGSSMNAGNGRYFLDVPITGSGQFANFAQIGVGSINLPGESRTLCSAVWDSSSRDEFRIIPHQASAVTHANPWAWAEGGELTFTLTYEAE